MTQPLSGVRIVECSMLGPAAITTTLADLGADVIKVEPRGEGDYVRRMAWPIIEGVSILHWHCNRGKRSLSLDLRKDEAVALYLALECHFGAGTKAHCHIRFSDGSKTSREKVELRCHQLLSDLCRSRRDVVKTVVAH